MWESSIVGSSAPPAELFPKFPKLALFFLGVWQEITLSMKRGIDKLTPWLLRPADPRNLTLTGQEKNRVTWAICKLNMLLHGFPDADIRAGDTIRNPLFVLPSVYPSFWRGLIAWAAKTGSLLPPIITFNYDLILERSLLYSVIGTHYAGRERFPGKGICIDYHTDCMAPIFLKHRFADFWKQEQSDGIPSQERGLILEECSEKDWEHDALDVNLLKLHGSCNFPKPRRIKQELPPAGERLALALEDPLILPPIFNKATETVGTGAWACAMQAMRHCKNLIICGYSLPQTDIYMQYFLKAALGPNRDLNKIFVFDPILFAVETEAAGTALKSRYAGNFSDPIQKRIEFQPAIGEKHRESGGTFEHLTWLLVKHPEVIFFG